MNKKLIRNHKSSIINLQSLGGFTLIELIIVFAVISILSTVGVASFVSYSRSQTLQQAANDLVTTLNLAKASTSTQVKVFNYNGGTIQCPVNTTLQGYSVTIDIANNRYNLSIVCSGSSIPATTYTKLPTGVTFNPTTDPTNPTTTTNVFFPVLTGGVIGSGNISLSSYGNTKTITVNSAGGIQ